MGLIGRRENRQTRRVEVGDDHTAAIMIGTLEVPGVRITSLSAGGCFILLPNEFLKHVHVGTIMREFLFEHPDLPDIPTVAQMVHITGDSGGPSDGIGVGVKFLSTSSKFIEWVDHYVSAYYAFQNQGECEAS